MMKSVPPPPTVAAAPPPAKANPPTAASAPLAVVRTPEDLAHKRALVCEEIIHTERIYVEQLQQLISCYQEPLQKAGVLREEDEKAIFINVRTLVEIHRSLLGTLEASLSPAQPRPDGQFAVGAALSSISPLLTLYVDYINRFHDGGETLRRLSTKRKFAKALEQCHHGNLAGLVALESLRVAPVQRVPRYVLLLREVLKCTPDEHADRAACQRAFGDMERVATLINEKKRDFEKAQRLVYIADHLKGNLGALRETAPSVGRPHVFVHQMFGLPSTCDWCKDSVVLQGYRCSACGFVAHSACCRQAGGTCGEALLERSDSTPQLIKASRKIIMEATLECKSTDMDHPSSYKDTPFEPRLVLLCSDCLIVLRTANNVDFELVDKVGFSHLRKGPMLERDVAPLLWSLANMNRHQLHTFRMADEAAKAEWVGAVDGAMTAWRDHVRRGQEQEAQVTQQLTGLKFHIGGTVPVHSAYEKPFTVYIIQMSNERGTITILKRYRQLLALHHALVTVYGEAALPPFPAKRLIGNTSESFLQKRSRELNAYLDGIVNLKDVLQVPQVRSFLTTTVSAKNEDELVPQFAPQKSPDELSAIESIISEGDGVEVIDGDDDDDDGNDDGNASMASEDLEGLAQLRATMAALRQSHAVATSAYSGSVAGSMSLAPGDELLVLQREGKDWCYCRRKSDGREGWVPVDYIHDEDKDEYELSEQDM